MSHNLEKCFDTLRTMPTLNRGESGPASHWRRGRSKIVISFLNKESTILRGLPDRDIIHPFSRRRNRGEMSSCTRGQKVIEDVSSPTIIFYIG